MSLKSIKENYMSSILKSVTQSSLICSQILMSKPVRVPIRCFSVNHDVLFLTRLFRQNGLKLILFIIFSTVQMATKLLQFIAINWNELKCFHFVA